MPTETSTLVLAAHFCYLPPLNADRYINVGQCAPVFRVHPNFLVSLRVPHSLHINKKTALKEIIVCLFFFPNM